MVTQPIPCRRENPDLWFSHAKKKEAKARQLCSTCPVRVACEATALATGERHGVWGGTTERERRDLRASDTVADVF